MPSRPCLRCGALGPASYCRAHQPDRSGSGALRGSGGKRATFRRRTFALTGGRCAVAGCRTPLDRVQAHHVVALADGGHPDGPGVPLCHGHHAQVSAAQRKTRNL